MMITVIIIVIMLVCYSLVFNRDCQCKTELLMHGIIVFDVKYGQHQWETASRALRCHFHQPALINQSHWSIKTVNILLYYATVLFVYVTRELLPTDDYETICDIFIQLLVVCSIGNEIALVTL